jgi:diguanylate cyclase (GGDEF)-like protein
MKEELYETILSEFIKTEEWNRIKDIVENKIGASYCWIKDRKGVFLYRDRERENKVCKLVKEKMGERRCESFLKESFISTKTLKSPQVKECFAGLLHFISPIVARGDFMGAIGGCQVVNADIPSGMYREIAQNLSVRKDRFISFLEQEALSISKETLKIEAELIALLATSSVEVLLKKRQIAEKDEEIEAISESYKLFSDQSAVSGLGRQNLYFIIVDLIARAMGAEICSLMTIDRFTQKMRIEAAVGLDPIIMSRTEVKVGEGIAGWVAKTGEPLLVKDITKDARFANRSFRSTRYYTNSFISVPLKADGEVFGVISVNNKTSREPFDEHDLELLLSLTSRIVRTADGEITPFPIKFKETEDLLAEKERAEKKINSLKSEIYEREMRERELLAEIDSLKKKAEERMLLLERREDIEQVKEELEKERLKVEVLEEELSLLKSQRRPEEGISEIERDIVNEFKKEAMRMMVEEETEEELKDALCTERERTKKQEEEIERLRAEILRLKRESTKKEIDLFRRQKEMMEVLKAESFKKKTELEELAEQRERIEMLYRVKQRMEEVAKLYEEAKRIKDKKAQAAHKETLEKLRRQATELEELRAQTRELSFLYNLSANLAGVLDEEMVFEKALSMSKDYFEYDLAGYIILKNRRLFCRIESPNFYLSGYKISGIKKRMVNDWLRWNPLRKKKAKRDVVLSVNQLEEREVFARISSYLSAPLRERDKVVGVIMFASCKKGVFSPTRKRILSIMADQVSVATEKARLFFATREAANRDELTGVYNFRYFEQSLNRLFELTKRNREPLSMIMLDFDRLKYVNDTFGHSQGNRLIKTIAHLIEKGVRESDLVGRFGGDEFGIILPATDSKTAYYVAERVRRMIAHHKMIIEGKPFSLTASLGVASYPKDGIEEPKDLLREADACLYRAKETGRNRVVINL